MYNSKLERYSAKIKNIYIELKNYKFYHSPYYKDEHQNRFIGRQRVIDRIVSILKETQIKSGSYLVTGFRGMGKTSVIREALSKFDKPQESLNEPNKTKLNFWRYDIIIFILLLIIFLYVLLTRLDQWQSFPNKLPLFTFFTLCFTVLFRIGNLILILIRKEKQFLGSIWNLAKTLLLFSIFLDITLFFYHLENYCDSFICLNLQSINFQIFDGFSAGVRLLIGVITFYVSVYILLFFNDSVIYGLKKEKKEVLSDRQKEKIYESFEINLSQDNLDEISILRRISIALHEYWSTIHFGINRSFPQRRFYFIFNFVLRSIKNSGYNEAKKDHKKILDRLNFLRNRMSGELKLAKEFKDEADTNISILDSFKLAILKKSETENNETAYPIANAKEAEDLLIGILEEIDKFRESHPEKSIPYFVFIIDELDKMDPNTNSNILDKEYSDLLIDNIGTRDTSRLRRRQEAVAKLLANLKGFLSTVRAKFFFVGGREMFDADLADIADRDSFYSSIFNDVIYVDSFFKDRVSSSSLTAGGITQMTEAYLCNIILNDLTKSSANPANLNLTSLFKLLNYQCKDDLNDEFSLRFIKSKNTKDKGEEKTSIEDNNKYGITKEEFKKQAYKLIFVLQNYIIYLAYRSNGTPKKLTALTEQLLVNGPSLNEDTSRKFYRDNIVVRHSEESSDKRIMPNDDLSNKLFLKFNYKTQYEIGLTSIVYRPYLIVKSRHIKSLGDKLLFSSPFIIDHILKFHPFGFSWRNLELIPEIVLVNREPNLRKYIEDLMQFYSINYIKKTVSGIFDYKFRSKVKRELIYLSKTSDLSAAAFNFTLDESLSTKRHYKRKLIQLQKKYKDYQPMSGDNKFIHAIGFVQTILADLHFYDKEYDEAIILYTESIQTLRLPNAVTDRLITRHQFLIWLRNQLKLGLSLEKIRAFDSAFSLYKTLILDTERYLKKVVAKGSSSTSSYYESKRNFITTEDHRNIHLLSMPFIALLAVTEKAREDGITYANLVRNREDFKSIILPETRSIDSKLVDEYRRNFLLADYYNNVGSILFYKNCQFPKFFEDKEYRLEVFQHSSEDAVLNTTSERIIKMQQRIYDKNKSKRVYDFFPSLTSFNFYWNSLFFLLKDHQDKITKTIENIPFVNRELCDTYPDWHIPKEVEFEDNLLANIAAFLLPQCLDLVNNNRLSYIAYVVVKLGDSILASVPKERFSIPENHFDPLDIVLNEGDGKVPRVSNIFQFYRIINAEQNLFSSEAILHIYKLAAALFKRSGQILDYARTLNKILYVIKDIIELNKEKVNTDFKQKIKAFISIDLTPDKSVDKAEKENTNENFNIPPKYRGVERIAEKIFEATTWNNEVANRPQILKYREIFGIAHNRDLDRDLIYNNLTSVSENREAIILVESIKLKLGAYNFENYLIIFSLGNSIISPYNTMNNRYLRILELKYRVERCFFIMKYILKIEGLLSLELYDLQVDIDEINNDLKKVLTSKDYYNKDGDETIYINDIVVFIIKESLFCHQELIKMINLYDPGYLIGYSFLAESHKRMGDWCLAYDHYLDIIDPRDKIDLYPKKDNDLEGIKKKRKNYKEYLDKIWPITIKGSEEKKPKEQFDQVISDILGENSKPYIEAKNHYESASQYYYKMLQLHSDNKMYGERLNGVYMLEDDYNENAAHFVIASERLRMNTGSIRKKINILNEQSKISKVYDYDSYFPSKEKEKDSDDKNIIDIRMKYLSFFCEKVGENKSQS